MTTRDLIALGISFAYASSLLVIAQVIRRWRGYPQDFTRKIVHVGAGMWILGVLGLFDNWFIGVISFGSFIVINYFLWRYKVLDAMDAPDSTPGTVYFAFSITLLLGLLWRKGLPGDMGYVAAAGTMAMTWGDSMAAILGKRFGRHRYTIAGGTRSWEGSGVMFLASAVSMFLVLMLAPGSALLGPTAQPLTTSTALLAALAGAIVAAVAEGLSPHGADNLSVPLLAGGTVFIVVTALT